ncbi:hypothetical protein Ab1vBOLIVR5_gp174 [Agrobacterium phage OLIVR5]|uniref:Uncharacterized protein n=1 Tax=Agrobacterium phage OLIVR5 TaxID=2723773 RepID=A0A858MSV9_9CAUD|nr:hypothetical protein KNU99_gp227 [Agrobacterium phage OLIVR5]QIW87822.1 hypothetical protein Ab1vBOLIVR5_gp174 [Agrobacterium phage OLIVR5]QIW88087.1 hypothetical protein Ab1vBOLIVR6_gp180 [Agrobacterium phage OLIVR6]
MFRRHHGAIQNLRRRPRFPQDVRNLHERRDRSR